MARGPGFPKAVLDEETGSAWQFFISGKARQTVFATGGRARTMNFEHLRLDKTAQDALPREKPLMLPE